MFSNTDSFGKTFVIWKLRARPRRLMSCGGEAGDVLAVQFDVAGREREAAADQVEQRRLAGAVRADHGVAFALLDGEVHAVDDRGLAEALADVLEFE
jgi:hypothetical protein